uniref:Uncharacterized protein n=1 Tax=Helianthus annuus TaxID=4232 RepID=A0A251UYN3_HELAN
MLIFGRLLVGWVSKKLSVILAPFLIGTRYTSFGRHFTKVDKLKERLFCRRRSHYAIPVLFSFEKELAAESLRRKENEMQKALDDLTNPDTNSDIQLFIESRKKKRARRALDATVESVVTLGFPREAATLEIDRRRPGILGLKLQATDNQLSGFG